MTIWQAILLAIVEGLTEFLPVSSTGHMILVAHLLGISNQEFVKLFEVNIQLGAILAVVVLYWRRLFQSFSLYLKLLAAFIPTVILGLLLNDYIDTLLESALVVGVNLLLGGIIFLFIDKWLIQRSSRIAKEDIVDLVYDGQTYKEVNFNKTIEELGIGNAAAIGLFQSVSMLPGVSRSAATIIGGQLQGMDKKNAAEFSFLLAIPTMAGATLLKSYKSKELLLSSTGQEWLLLGIGNAVAFLVALLAVKAFVSILVSQGFKPFGYYRILVGGLIVALVSAGVSLQIL